MSKRLLLAGLAAALAFGTVASGASAATFTVTNTTDSLPGSLREASQSANRTAGHDLIEFAIAGAGPHRITPLTELPRITDPVTIDGYGGAARKPDSSAPAVLRVEIDTSHVKAGLRVATDDSLITGLVVNGVPTGAEIHITGDRNRITGSHVGTDVAGSSVASTGFATAGIEIEGDDNQVGGKPVERNVISGYYFAGVLVTAGTGNVIAGNRIGTNAAGTAGLGSGWSGVRIPDADGNTVRENVLSGGWADGLYVGGDESVIQGNLIGTDITGTTALANGEGIIVGGGSHNQIGGSEPGEGNVISGNAWYGIELSAGDGGASADDNVIEGNMIGVDVDGAEAMPNGYDIDSGDGILICAGDGNVIGGTEAGAANVIAANTGDGVHITCSASGNRLLGNRIGTNLRGAPGLGNTGSGVHIQSSDNEVGDPDAVAGLNVIAHNGEDGVEVENGTGNAILRNSMFRNDGLGIDLGPDGRNVDDSGDPDVGANDLQNAPSLTTALTTPTATTVTWELDSLPATEMRIDFYWSSACDPTGFGEGLIHLGATTDTTGGGGLAAGSIERRAFPAGSVITATATPLAAGTPMSTSEFSECMVISDADG